MILRITQALLTLAGDPHAEYIAGDLREEFLLMRPHLGPWSGARWYSWQLVRSLSLPMARRILAIALPLFMLDRAWALFFDQLCLLPTDGLPLVNAVCLCAGVFLTRPSLRIPIASLLVIGLASALIVGAPAFPHVFAASLAVPAGMLAAQVSKSRPLFA
jgi:hypothetical protein